MRYGVALSQHPVPSQATGEVIGSILEQVGEAPDLAVLVASRDLTGAMDDVVAAVRTILRPAALVGGTTATVIGGAREVEDDTALVLWAGRPGRVAVHHLTARAERVEVVVDGVPDDLPAAGTAILWADPWSFPLEVLLARLGASHPRLVLAGGLASAAQGPGGNRLVADGEVHPAGAVLAVLPPTCEVVVGVSQGCTPVGEPMIVTRAEGRALLELAGQPALDRLAQVLEGPVEGQPAVSPELQLGVVVDEGKDRFGPGDFLIRPLVGADRGRGALLVDEPVGVGTTVQIHRRDRAAADADLDRALSGLGPADGALLFTGNERGTTLFGLPDHDAEAVSEVAAAAAGTSTSGEVGPVGGVNHVHRSAAVVVVFRGP